MPRKNRAERAAQHAAYVHTRYHTDPDYKAKHLEYVAGVKARLQVKVKTMLAQARSGGCGFCPEDTPCCMSFHHVDPSEKLFPVAYAIGRGYSAKTIAAELAKCVRLCENCHRKVHAGIIPNPASLPRVVVSVPPNAKRQSQPRRPRKFVPPTWLPKMPGKRKGQGSDLRPEAEPTQS